MTLAAGADLVMISPDSLEEHRNYALTLFREELPYLYVSDNNLDIARLYELIRAEEHPTAGFITARSGYDATIMHKSVPWEGNATQALKNIRDYSRSSTAHQENGELHAA